MRRLHLFELEDQPWLPGVIRDAGTAYLEYGSRIMGHAKVVAPILAAALRRNGETRIVDLCSGGAGPLPSTLAEIAATEDLEVTATLTDLYPNRAAFEAAIRNHPALSACFEPVDATAVPADLRGVRTLFNGFHHFRPELARAILEKAVEDRAPIVVLEGVARHPLALLSMFFAPIISLFLIPFLRPFRWEWIPLTYLVPVIPLFIFWDGFVSCLRVYDEDELRELTSGLGSPSYVWEIGKLSLPGTAFDTPYLVGSPVRSA
jgi:hypothetical protein